MRDLEYEFERTGYLMSNKAIIKCLMDLGYRRSTAKNLLYFKGCPRAPIHADAIAMWVRHRRTRKHRMTRYMWDALHWRDRGLTFRQIAEKMGVCLSTAHRAYKKGRLYELEAPIQGQARLDGLTQM